MELIIIFLILLPIVGYVMQQYGVGATKQAESFLPDMQLSQIRPLLMYFTKHVHWHLILERNEDETSTYIFQVGQWGLSPFGARRIGVVSTQEQNGIKVTIEGLSLLGQFYDFGVIEKDIDKLVVFLTDISTNSQLLNRYMSVQGNFLSKKDLIDYKYFVIILVLFSYLLVSYYQGYRDRQQAIPGNIIITFREGITDEDMYRMLNNFGAGSCEHKPPDNTRRFFCAVPIGDEQKVINAAKSMLLVEDAIRWHGE